MEMCVGWIGTGRMGVAMAANLARAGVSLKAWNRTAAKAEPLARFGATVADSISELRTSDVVFTMVSTAADLDTVLFGEGGLLAGPGPLPEVLVDCSTIAAPESAEVRGRCEKLGVAFLACPVSGNGKVVRSGGLTFVASGPEQVFERVRPLLEHIGASAIYVGDGEAARLVKIAHNLMLGVVTQCLAEITVLAEKGGVSRHAFLEFLNSSVMGSTFTRYKTPAFVNLDYTPTFTPTLLRKDFDLGLAAARQLDVPMPLASLTAALVQASIGTGRTDEDFAILLDLQAAASGITLEPENRPVDDGLAADPELDF